MTFLNKLSLIEAKLRCKLVISYALMSIVPLLIAAYLIFYFTDLPVNAGENVLAIVSIVMLLTILISFLGFFLSREAIEPIVDVSLQAEKLARGESMNQLPADRKDEVGDLSRSLNEISQNVKKNLEELKKYGEETERIDKEIHHKVLALTHLLQVSDRMAAGCSLEETLNLISDRLSQLVERGVIFIFFPDENRRFLCKNTLKDSEQAHEIIDAVAQAKKMEVINMQTKVTLPVKKLRDEFEFHNGIALPVMVKDTTEAVLLVGSKSKSFEFHPDDIKLVDIFVKQIGIAIENDQLIKKTEKLAVKDTLTNLYNESYIRNRLEEEIQRSIRYQRPCSFALMNVDNYERLTQKYGGDIAESLLKQVAQIIQDRMIEVDRAARVGPDEFALLLPEKNKKESISIAEDLRKKIETVSFTSGGNDGIHLTVSLGLSENPIDGSSAAELYEKATTRLRHAKSIGKNRLISQG